MNLLNFVKQLYQKEANGVQNIYHAINPQGPPVDHPLGQFNNMGQRPPQIQYQTPDTQLNAIHGDGSNLALDNFRFNNGPLIGDLYQHAPPNFHTMFTPNFGAPAQRPPFPYFLNGRYQGLRNDSGQITPPSNTPGDYIIPQPNQKQMLLPVQHFNPQIQNMQNYRMTI